jgi:hypothetical protein
MQVVEIPKVRVEGRIDPVFMQFKDEHETKTEFMERAFKALREKELNGDRDGIEHGILIKMCRVFIKKKIRMDFTKKEADLLDELIRKEVLGK